MPLFSQVLYTLFLVSSVPTADDVREALKFQYEQKVSALQKENESLKKKLKAVKIEAGRCERVSDEIKTNREEVELDREMQERAYREALKDIQNENWSEGLVSMETFLQKYPESEFADNALYWMAQIYLQRQQHELARAELERLLTAYPSGDRAERARADLSNFPVQLTSTTKEKTP